MEAAAILEDLLEDSEVFPEAGGLGDLASELGAPAEENPSTAREGAGSAASSAAAPPRPPFPTGLGEGGLGQGGAKREGAGNLEEARPPKQSSPRKTAKKAQRIERLRGEAEELWARIESWASADDPAQTQQRLASVMELLDSAPDPAQIQQARLDQLRKLWRLKAFTPVHKKDKPTAAQTFHYKWVDKVIRRVWRKAASRVLT